MIDTLKETKNLLEELGEDIRVHSLYGDLCDLLERIEEKGITQGAKELDGQMFVEFPSPPGSDIDEFEKRVMNFLNGKDSISSTSALAEQLAEHLDIEYDSSFRSRVQYNVSKLDKKGYVNRDEIGNRLETQLSTMGRMWVATHDGKLGQAPR